jgi:C-terminal processing protease CtpA/Prc
VGSVAGALRRAGAEVLVVDLTGNGGGSEWSSAVAAILAGRPLHRGPTGFVKHPHWTERLREEALRSDPRVRSSIEAALAEAEAVCDRRFLWLGGENLPACRQDVVAHLPPETIPVPGDDPPARWTGELWILVDGGTASAAEEVPALLADNGAARVIGEATFGAGCGYTNGGIPAELPHSGLTVWMPDCARYRRDGTNEVEAVRPHVPVAWSEMNGEARARALATALAR